LRFPDKDSKTQVERFSVQGSGLMNKYVHRGSKGHREVPCQNLMSITGDDMNVISKKDISRHFDL
jgi:hypothetical protein